MSIMTMDLIDKECRNLTGVSIEQCIDAGCFSVRNTGYSARRKRCCGCGNDNPIEFIYVPIMQNPLGGDHFRLVIRDSTRRHRDYHTCVDCLKNLGFIIGENISNSSYYRLYRIEEEYEPHWVSCDDITPV